MGEKSHFKQGDIEGLEEMYDGVLGLAKKKVLPKKKSRQNKQTKKKSSVD